MADGSCQFSSGLSVLLRRGLTGDQTLDTFLDLVQSPFQQRFSTNAFLASLGISIGISALIFIVWCLLRPYHSLVYAPKLRYTDEKHAPPQIGKGYFSWLQPLMKCNEKDLVGKIGMDATIFLRFMRLCRTLFFFLGILGCLVMIPLNVSCNKKDENQNHWDPNSSWYVMMSPTYIWGDCMWGHVFIAWIFDFIIMFFLLRNYRAVVGLRRDYFESPEYTRSLHSRTLMIWDIPKSYRSDAGLNKLVSTISVPTHGDEKCAIGRNVKELPELMEKHEKAVQKLEEILAKYFKNPDHLPSARPVCKPDKDDKSMADMNVDAIQYYKRKIEDLEHHIISMRKSIDTRDSMQYGFVSYPTISRAHITAKAARGKHPKGITIKLAAKPHDIIWENFSRTKPSRRWNRFIGNVLFTILSLLYVIPNVLIAVFLSNLHNIAAVFPNFGQLLATYPRFFAAVQGFLAPTITSIIYLLLPSLMRKMSTWQGDITKTSRELHVTHKLYVFFIINNLIMFTIFGTLWSMVFKFLDLSKNGVSWETFLDLKFGDSLAIAINDISTFWITYLLQRNMGAMLDLAQVTSLVIKSFSIRFLSPTPRQRIEWTAPPPFEYATYYNYFLFYTTIALCFSTIQPLVLPVAFIYFLVDSLLKKYTLMYVFVSKVEGGGAFWRLVFNRLLFATGLFNCVIALIVWTKADGRMASTVLPLLLVLVFFKIYCNKTYDVQTRYHTRGSDRDSIIATSSDQFSRKDKLGMKYSHPALHRKLMKPMVAGKAEHLMAQVYHGGSESSDGVGGGIDLHTMQHGIPGRRTQADEEFEVVQEADMDLVNFRNRPDFGEYNGGNGSTYGDDQSILTPPTGFGSPMSSRPGTPGTPATPLLRSPLAMSNTGARAADYIPVTGAAPPLSPGFAQRSLHRPESPYDYSHSDNRSETGSVVNLLNNQQMPAYTQYTPYTSLPQHHTSHGQPPPPRWQPSQPSQPHHEYDNYDEYRDVHR